MKFVPNKLTQQVGNIVLQTKFQSPKLLFAAGVVGVGATVVLACKATLKLEDVLTDAEKTTQDIKSSVHIDQHEVQKDLYYHRIATAGRLVKLYAPATAVGVLSVAALTGSHHILSKRNAALTAAYATIEKVFNEYRERVRNELGEEKDRQFRYGAVEVKETVETKDGPKVKTTTKIDGSISPSGYAKFFDEYNRNFKPTAELNLYWLKCQQRWLNDKLTARGYLFLNEVYEELGMEPTDAGQVVGWWIGEGGGDGYVDFGIWDGENDKAREFVNGYEKAILLDFNVDGVIYNKFARHS